MPSQLAGAVMIREDMAALWLGDEGVAASGENGEDV